MALTDRDIIITPNRGAAVEPKIQFTGADSVSSGTITLKVLNDGTTGILSFEGNSGQLLSIADTMSGTIFSANDISGIPSIEVLDTGLVKLAQYNGTVVIGTGTNATGKLQIYGNTWNNSTGGDLVVRNPNSVGAAITLMPTNSASFSAGWSLYAGASGATIGDGAVGLWNHTASAARLYVNQAGNLTVTGSVSGTQFYDSTNSAFYLYPTGNSRLRGISSLGSELASGHDPYGLVSVTRGTASNYAYFGLTRSGQVGMGIGIDTSNNLWFGGTTGGYDGTRNSTYFYSDPSGNVYANTSFRAPVFYDSASPTYYGDFGSTTNQYQAISFGDSTRYSAVSTTLNGAGAGDKLILYGNTANYDARVLVGADYDFIFKSQGQPANKGSFKFYSGTGAALALTIDSAQQTISSTSMKSPIYYDNNTAYYFNGDGTTNLLNLTVNGTLSVSNFSSNLISLGAQRQYYLGKLAADATQAKRYEVARLFVDVANWHDAGVMLVELQNGSFVGGDYQLWSVNYDYSGATGQPTCRLIKGDSPRGRYAQVTIGSPVQISGNYYYISVYVDVRYYSSYYTFVKTTQTSNSNATAASSGSSWVFTTPTGSNIADFTPSTTVTTNNTLESTADMRAPIFYDTDNTGYYINPTGTSNLNEVQFQNGKWFTSSNLSGNSTDMYIRPDNNNTYVWRMIFGGSGTGYGTGAGGFGIYNQTLGGDYSAIFPSSGYAVFPYSVRSPIYYDYTDTAYYVDPNSNSYINFLRAAGNMQANGGAIAIPTSYKNVPGVTPGTTGDWKRGSASLIMSGSQNTDGTGWAYGSRIVNVDYGDGLGMSVDVNYLNSWTNDALFVSGRAGKLGNVGINQTAPVEKLDIVGRLKITSGGYGWIYGNDVNHSIIMRGDRDGTAANYTNYYQYGGTHANALGHRFWTGGTLASQTEKFRISDNVTASFQQIYAPSLYDINDTGYYLDPNGTSNLYRGYFAQLMKRNNRFSNGDRYPLGHYSDGDMVWNIDPSWSEYELQEYFGSSNVTWVADSTAPGGYAIQIAGGVNVATNSYGSGFPMIPIDSADDVFYMEIWIKGISGTANHYMGSIDFNENFANLGGNPGSYGYWVLVGNVPGTSWSKWYGYIGGFGSDYGTFKPGAKYWSPQALFNYSGGTSYISGWKVLRVNRQTSMIINTPNGSSSTGASSSRGQTLTIKRSNTTQLNLGSYPGAWTSALQIQDNNATNWLWMSPLTGYTPTIATNYGAINYYMASQNSGFAGSMNNGSFRSPIFYDSDDTTYYLDPNADLSLKVYGEISNSNYAIGNLQPGALNIGRTDLNYNWGGSWSGNVLTGILANCLNNWEFAIHDSGERVVSPFAFFGGSSYYLEMGRDIGWGTMPIYATNSFRAPIFYDSNDTSYYIDGNSTSYIRSLFLGAHDSGASEFRFGEDSSGWYGDRWYWDSGYNVYRYSRFAGTDSLIHYHDTRDTTRITYGRNIVFDNYGKGIVGTYDSYRLQGVFSMGDAYKLPADGTSAGNLYGLAWSHPNAGSIGGANNLNSHGLLLINNGGFRAAISSRAVFSADVRGTLFYDYNDTTYYCDPNSESNLFKPTYYTQQNWNISYRAVGRSRITSDQNYWTNTAGWSQDYGNWGNYWKFGFGGFDCWGTNTDHPQGSGYVHAQGIQSGLHYANSDGSAGYGWQMVGAADATANRYWARGKWGGSTSAWKEFAMYGASIASSFYASIYYDADNTAFYVDPASTSNIGRLLATWSGQQGHIIRRTDNPGTNGVTLLVQNDYGNNSWGIVSEFRVNGAPGTDSPSILFSQGYNSNTWSAGFGDADTGLFRIKYDHGYRNGGWGTTAFYIDRSSNTFSNGSSRAPIFYDLNDTGYYIDPNSASDSALRMRGGALFGPNTSWGKYLYVGGNGRVGTTASVAVTNGNLHLDSEDGYILYLNYYSGQPVYSRTIYDLNDTAYFLDPNSRSRLSSIDYGDGGYYFAGGDWGYRHNTPYGWIQFGPANPGHAHIYTDRSNFYFNVYDLYTNGRWVITENYTQNGKYMGSDGSVRANIFYDQADTSYYVDINADRSSNINGVNATTQAKLGTTYKYNNWRPYITGDSNYWVGSMGWGTQDLGDIFMWGSGFWDSWSSPGNAPSGTSHWTGLTSQHYNQGSLGYGWQLTMGAGDPGLFYVRGMWGVKNNTWYKVAIYDYNSNAARPFYASIYYDANNTGYYADPDSTSVFYRLNINNNVYFTNYGRGMVGSYASTRYQAVFAMGDSYKLPDDGTSTGSLYGLAWSHPNAGGVAGNLNTHGLLAMENGNWLASLTGSTRARDDMRAPIFYDNNNTGYYTDQASTSNHNVQIAYSYQGNGNVGGTGSASWHPSGIYSAGFNWLYGGGNAGGNNWTNFARIDSNIYYDYNNTAYYVDPASVTYLYGGIWNNGGHSDSSIKNRLLSGNNGGGTGEVRLQMWCSEPGNTWDWAGFGYNVDNNSNAVAPAYYFGRPNASFGQAYMRFGTGGQWYFYTAGAFGGTRYTNMYLAPNNGVEVYGRLYSDSRMDAPIFYDANNTGYYVDPNNTSRIVTLLVDGDITVGVGQTSSNIYMADTDEGQRRIHCNSNRIGFLSEGNAWGSYCGDGGEWYSDQSVRSPIFYDNNNTAYYCDPNGYSQFSSGEFNNYARVARLSFIGEGGNSGQGNNAYSIYQEGGGWGYPYPDLAIGFHTGIKIGAYFGYNGTRIYNNHDFSTQIASFGDGDNNFRSYYNVIAYASDERLKENIVNIPDALAKVQKLNGVTFDWKAMVTELGFEPQAWHEVGVLAQQVESVLPEAVETAPFDYDWEKPNQSKSGERYLTVKYEKIVPLLIEAIKDQQKIIEDQETRISRLESLIEKSILGK